MMNYRYKLYLRLCCVWDIPKNYAEQCKNEIVWGEWEKYFKKKVIDREWMGKRQKEYEELIDKESD